MIRQNWLYKLIALLGAVALWFYVNSERYPHTAKTIEVPIKIANLSSGYIAELGTRGARVTVRGLKSVVDSVRPEDAQVWVDLSSVRGDVGPHDIQASVRARISDVLARDAQITVSPKVVTVHLEPVRGKRMPVELKLTTAPPLGFKFGNPALTPASVSVSGPATSVARVQRLVVAAGVKPDGASVSGDYEVIPMDSAGSQVFGVVLDPPKTRLDIALIPVPASKLVVVSANVVDAPKFPTKVISVSVKPESITLQGKPEDLAQVSTVTTEPVSVRESTTTVTRDVAIRIPRELSARPEVRRARVTVTIRADETDEQ